jgi:hypothetical protein
MDLTTKQFGDACEHYVIAMLGFAHVPAQKMPDSWPGNDVIAQPLKSTPVRVSVKGRNAGSAGSGAFRLDSREQWDWVAVVLRYPETGRVRCWMLPRDLALRASTPEPNEKGTRRLRLATLEEGFSQCEGMFRIGTPVTSWAV